MNTSRQLIATIAGFLALAFFLLSLIYWAFIASPAFSFNLAQWDWTLRIMLIGAIIGFSVYLIAAPESIGQAAGRRSNRLTANAIVAIVVALAIAIVVNIIFESMPTVRADWTAAKRFSLSEQTIKILQNLNTDVNAVAFHSDQYPQGSTRQEIEDLLKEYSSRTAKFSYEFVDPIAAPARANQLTGGRQDVRLGNVLFSNGRRGEKAEAISEAAFTGALVRLGQTSTPVVAFMTGHGERDPNGFDQFGYSQVSQSLQQDNYQVINWNTAVTPTLTISQATVLVIAEPKRALTQREVQAVQSYLDGGGHLLLLLDSLMPTEALQPLTSILQKYGLTAVQGGVIDFQSNFNPQEPTSLLVGTYPSTSEITQPLSSNKLTTWIPLSLGLRVPTTTLEGLQVTSILQSSFGEQSSWLETDIKPGLESQIQLRYDAGKDIPGPVNLAVTVGPQDVSASGTTTNTQQVKTKLVVYGDSDFPSNFALQQGLPVANLDLFTNSVSWLAGRNELVSIRAKDPETPQKIVLNEGQQRVVLFSSVIGLPLLIIMLGGFIWWRRR